MATALYCDPCDRRDKTSIAKKFCSDCDDKLCLECSDVHMTLKLCVNHHVVDVTVTTDQSLTVNKYCDKHADLTLEFYCCDHDVMCCRSCMADDHRTCGKLTPIEVASKDIKSSVMFEEISKQVNHLQEASSQMTDAMKKSKQVLNESKTASIEQVSKLKEKLHQHIDKVANESVSVINKLYSELSEKVNTNETEVTKKVQIIQEALSKFDSVAKHGSDKQIFLLLNSMKNDMHKIDTDLDDFMPTLKTLSIELEEPDVTTMLSSLGSITDKQRPCDIQYKPIKQQQAQFSINSNPAPTRFKFKKKVTFTYEKNVLITGMCVIKDNQIILCNWADDVKELLVLTSQGRFIQSIQLTDRPWNITMEPSTTDAWVTLPFASYIQVIDTKCLSLKRHVEVSRDCYGITFVGSNIALGKDGKVDIINNQGINIKTIDVGAQVIFSLCYSGRNKLYCCDSTANMFHCVSLDGIKVFSYSFVDIQTPTSVNADHQGNLYVLCRVSNNVHKFTAEGKPIGVACMLHRKNGLNRPFSSAFDNNCSKLFIANQTTNELFIFACK